MPKVVLDTTVLVSALLNPNPGGASIELLRFAKQGSFELFISDEILEETAEVLKAPRLRKRYAYADEDIVAYCHDLALIGAVVSNVPEVRGIVVRDPNDDMVVACALAADAEYIVTRDKDLLSLGEYGRITMVAPEEFLHVLRDRR